MDLIYWKKETSEFYDKYGPNGIFTQAARGKVENSIYEYINSKKKIEQLVNKT